MKYDKNNNDTYIKKYSNHMAQDVEMHMFNSDNGSTVMSGVRGTFSVETATTSKNNVLHFETATLLKLQLIKYKDKESLIPLSLIKRYERNLYDITYIQKNPVFFDLNSEKFVCVLDNRFLRDLENNPDFKQIILNIDGVSLVTTKNNEQVLLSYDSLSDLYSDKTEIYKNIKDCYLKEMLKIFPTEDVIIVSYSLEENKESYFYPNGNYSPIINKKQILNHIFSCANIQFEFFKARKVSPNYYYCYENDELNIQNNFYLDKEKRRQSALSENKSSTSLSSINLGSDKQVIIVSYSDEDWNVLTLLKNKMDSIFTDLDTLLLKQKTDNELDKPLTEIKHDDYLAICQSQPKRIGLKP